MKTAVVTGASRGLGIVIANHFAQNDWKVIGIGRSPRPDDLDTGIDYSQFDASDYGACEKFWQHFDQEGSEICLVNNAGGYVGGGLLEIAAEDYKSQMQSIYFSAVYMTQALVKTVPKATIVNIISNSAHHARAGDSAYGSAKTAEKYFFQALQKELEPQKYRITNLYPSNIATHGPKLKAVDPADFAAFIRQIAENDKSFYMTDVTIFPTLI